MRPDPTAADWVTLVTLVFIAILAGVIMLRKGLTSRTAGPLAGLFLLQVLVAEGPRGLVEMGQVALRVPWLLGVILRDLVANVSPLVAIGGSVWLLWRAAEWVVRRAM